MAMPPNEMNQSGGVLKMMPKSGDHMMITAHEDGYTTQSSHDGKMHGPEQHATMGQLRRHVSDCLEGDCSVNK